MLENMEISYQQSKPPLQEARYFTFPQVKGRKEIIKTREETSEVKIRKTIEKDL